MSNLGERRLEIGAMMDASGVRFGTSGARGRVVDMTDEVCFAYTAAFIQTLPPGTTRVALAIDLRPSSPAIASACAAAITAAGMTVVYCGAIPTPALAYFAQVQRIPGVMVTGSHIPFDRNGIKFYGMQGEITKADESSIAAARVALPAVPLTMKLPAADEGASALYLARYLDFFPSRCLEGMRLGFYEHSSVARNLLTVLLQRLGATVISLGRTDQFVPIDTEAVAEADVLQARAWASEHGFDAILSTDGDADRPLLGDEHGNWLRGDVAGILCAQALGAKAVVTTVSCNTALELSGAFATVRRTRIGSPYVIAGIEALIAAGEQSVVGFEPNGGFLVGTPLARIGGGLSPLMTRDAVLPILCLLYAARSRRMPVSALARGLPPRFTASDRLQNFPTETSQRLLVELAASNAALSALLVGIGEAASLDQTDGLRVALTSGEIIHFRPSGNAPELRCYAEATTQARAGALVQLGLQRMSAHGG